ncbi:MAG: hypothetical protein FJW35_11245 [Acidobacteria bacterium]|nr:hypothetical protein [Acidobacteriota bacterium]
MITTRGVGKARKCLLLLAAALVLLTTSAAAADFHPGLRHHKECVLCQLGQLALTVQTTSIDLPPPVLVVAELSAEETTSVQSHIVGTISTRAPPA